MAFVTPDQVSEEILAMNTQEIDMLEEALLQKVVLPQQRNPRNDEFARGFREGQTKEILDAFRAQYANLFDNERQKLYINWTADYPVEIRVDFGKVVETTNGKDCMLVVGGQGLQDELVRLSQKMVQGA